MSLGLPLTALTWLEGESCLPRRLSLFPRLPHISSKLCDGDCGDGGGNVDDVISICDILLHIVNFAPSPLEKKIS